MVLDSSLIPEQQVVYIDDIEIFVELAKDWGIPCIRRVNCLSTAEALAAVSRTIDQNNNIHG